MRLLLASRKRCVCVAADYLTFFCRVLNHINICIRVSIYTIENASSHHDQLKSGLFSFGTLACFATLPHNLCNVHRLFVVHERAYTYVCERTVVQYYYASFLLLSHANPTLDLKTSVPESHPTKRTALLLLSDRVANILRMRI